MIKIVLPRLCAYGICFSCFLITSIQTIAPPPEAFHPSRSTTDKALITEWQSSLIKIKEWQYWYDIQIGSNYFYTEGIQTYTNISFDSTESQLDLIISHIKNITIKTAIIFIKHTGIRVGALDTLKICQRHAERNNKYYAYSKGKDIVGPVSDELLEIISSSGLDIIQPFKSKSSEVVRNSFRRVCKSLHACGIINDA